MRREVRQCRACAVVLFALLCGSLELRAQAPLKRGTVQSTPPSSTLPNSGLSSSGGTHENATADLPDSPSAIASKAATRELTFEDVRGEIVMQASLLPQQTQSSPSQPLQSQPPQSQSSQSQSSPAQQQSQPPPPQKPVGTAIAGSPTATGIAASQPAGMAVAPAKQRRVRTIILRTGAIIGAGVALGTIVALTAATPSKPPGAH